MAATPGTPWWERKEAELKERSADDATCSISSSETVRVFFFPFFLLPFACKYGHAHGTLYDLFFFPSL